MSNPSADRPPTPPEMLFSEEDVREARAAYVESGSTGPIEFAFEWLASAGRLLPVDAEHREHEFTVEYVHPMDRQYRRQRMEPCMDTLAEVTEYADGLRTVGYIDVKVFRRTRAVDAGRWVEVDADA